MNEVMKTISSFEPIDTAEVINEGVFGILEPETDPFNPAFEQFGIESTIMAYNSSNLVWGFWYQIFLIVIMGFSCWFALCIPSCLKVFNCTKKTLLWNGLLLFFLETYMDLSLVAILQVIDYDEATAFPIETYSYRMAVLFLLC